MKNVVMISIITMSLMATAFLSYREGYKDGKENKFNV